jgi:hypothetical protein
VESVRLEDQVKGDVLLLKARGVPYTRTHTRAVSYTYTRTRSAVRAMHTRCP